MRSLALSAPAFHRRSPCRASSSPRARRGRRGRRPRPGIRPRRRGTRRPRPEIHLDGARGRPQRRAELQGFFRRALAVLMRREVDDVDNRLSRPVGRQQHRRAALRDRCARGRTGRRLHRRSGNGRVRRLGRRSVSTGRESSGAWILLLKSARIYGFFSQAPLRNSSAVRWKAPRCLGEYAGKWPPLGTIHR